MRNGTTLKQKLRIKLLEQNKLFAAEHASLYDMGEKARGFDSTLNSHHFLALSNCL